MVQDGQVSKWLSCGSGDDLNLAGVLNVLDGVVDSPGRIVIMTSNHPEKLDPALIRPGRINKQLHLGAMSPPQAARMAAHHYPGADSVAFAALEHAVPGDMVPARLEALCAEYEEIADLIAALEAESVQAACSPGASFGDVNNVHDIAAQVQCDRQESDASTCEPAEIEQCDVLQSGSSETSAASSNDDSDRNDDDDDDDDEDTYILSNHGSGAGRGRGSGRGRGDCMGRGRGKAGRTGGGKCGGKGQRWGSR